MSVSRLFIAIGLLTIMAPAHANWMTFVGRNVDTGERLGLGASVNNEDEAPVLSLLCTPTGLTATFDTGLDLTKQNLPPDQPVSFFLAADGGFYDPFPAAAEPHDRGNGEQLRLRLVPDEAKGLAEYVLGAESDIVVSYRVNDVERVFTRFSIDSAAVTIGAVLAECGQRDKTPSQL